MNKYKLTEEKRDVYGRTLFQIEATASFGSIDKGDKGGWIEKENNLSQEGDAWVSDNAMVYGDARVYGDAWVSDDAMVSGNAMVFGNARVSDDAWVSDNAMVSGNAMVYGNARVFGKYKLTAGSFFGYQYQQEDIKHISQGNDYTLIAKGDVKCEPTEEKDDATEEAIALLKENGYKITKD